MIRDVDIADLITTTLHKLGRGRFHQIAQQLTEYEVMSWLLKKNGEFGGVNVISDGLGIKEYLMVKYGDSFRWVGLFEKDNIDITDHLTEMKVEWCRGTDNMAWERREILENRGESRLNNVIIPRRVAMMLRVAQNLENAFFADPIPGESKIPWGLPYWIVKNSTTGFNGGVHPALAAAGVTTVGNVNPEQYPTFKNYTDTYSAFTKEDLVRKLRKAHRKTAWKSPISLKEFRSVYGERRRLFVNEETISALESIAESQNDNLGIDLAPYDGETTFKRHPIRYVPKLDDDTSNPVYMIDLATFMLFVLEGDYLRESDARVAPFQHNVFVVHVDLSYNTLCVNRRANAVLYQA
ncbi:MAG TPA: phage major capsid protein [Anaerohalosphaeraceae bacterium]|nr:phage major capsid protein [Anaerohalosphaeraceae bacterium]HOL90004.1 phage major capsid protein [Anaerohalosphaeraceae bacterium]HPP57409.1 phage major capsid protein [Anaerohalosphaeraceae bacterium]